MNHRPSSIRTYDNCEFRGFHEYYDKSLPLSEPYEGYALGSCFHELMRAHIHSVLYGDVDPDISPYSPEVYQEALKIQDRFLEWFDFNPDLVLTCEEPITFENVTGIPDFTLWTDETQKELVIIDWKSSWAEQGHEYDSLGYYAAIFANLYPKIKKFHLRICLTRFSYYLDDVTLKRDEALDTWRLMQAKIKKIESIKEPKATAGRHCDMCQVRLHCPLANEELLHNIVSDEQAKHMAEVIVATDAAQKERKKVLKSWCNEHGNIELDNGIFGFKESERVEWDASVLKHLTKEERAEAIKIDNRFMDKFSDEFKDKVSEFKHKKLSTRFELHKRG